MGLGLGRHLAPARRRDAGVEITTVDGVRARVLDAWQRGVHAGRRWPRERRGKRGEGEHFGTQPSVGSDTRGLRRTPAGRVLLVVGSRADQCKGLSGVSASSSVSPMKGARARGDVLVANSCEALTNLVGRYNLARLRSREIKSRQLNGPAPCRAAEPTVSCHRQRVTEGQSLSVYSLLTPPPCPIVPCQSRRPSGGMVGGVGNLAGSRGSPRGERMHEPSGVGERCGVASMRGGVHSE